MTPKLAYILSLPRSGSTVLTSMLDQKRGVISPPESSFPQVLGQLKREEREDAHRLAAWYLASTFPGTPLNLDEAAACMKGDDESILIEIGRALAGKLGRNPDEVSLVAWKTTRTISMNDAPLRTSGRFVILRRHPHNVFESQFRVHFGANNRHPMRFAAFRESYEWAFSRIPVERRFDLDYEEIPDRLEALLEFLGIDHQGEWESGSSSLEHVAGNRPWLSQILDEFRSDDDAKRERLNSHQRISLKRSLRLAAAAKPLMPMLRRRFDRAVLATIGQRVDKILHRSGHR